MVTYANEDLYKQDSIEKQLKITYDGGTISNELVHQENFTLSESLCSESQLTFGSCEACSVQFRVSSVVASLKDKWITISETLDGDTDTPFTFGRYKVETEKLTADRSWRDITAYDAMYDIINADVAEWYNTVLPNDDSTCTLKEFRDSFMEHFGLEQVDTELVNDSMTVTKTISVTASSESEDDTSTVGESISGKDVITAICEINGCFGHINREGKFQYIYLQQYVQGLYPANDLYPDHAPDYLPYQQDTGHLYPQAPRISKSGQITKSLYISCTYDDFLTKAISKVQIRQEENDIGAIVGDGNNCYVIEGNFLVYGKSTEELTTIGNNLLGKMKGIMYRPFECEAKGNPCLEVGDTIRFNTTSEIVEGYVLQRTLKGIQALRDTYTAEGVEKYAEEVNSVQTSIRQLKGKANILSRTIEETQSTIVDMENDLQTQITQNTESIKSTVAASTSKYDEGDYEGKIQNYGYGTPSADMGSDGEYYLDQDSGKLYTKSSGAWKETATLSLITAKLQSSIEQNADNITLKVDTAGVISAINQSAEDVTIDASKINLNGAVSANGYFKIGTDGKITITNGDIYSSNGTRYVRIKNGALSGGFGTTTAPTTETGILDFGSKLDGNSALDIRADNLVLCATRLAIGQSKNQTSNLKVAKQSYDCKYVYNIVDNGDGTITWYTSALYFRNGICCNA